MISAKTVQSKIRPVTATSPRDEGTLANETAPAAPVDARPRKGDQAVSTYGREPRLRKKNQKWMLDGRQPKFARTPRAQDRGKGELNTYQ